MSCDYRFEITKDDKIIASGSMDADMVISILTRGKDSEREEETPQRAKSGLTRKYTPKPCCGSKGPTHRPGCTRKVKKVNSGFAIGAGQDGDSISDDEPVSMVVFRHIHYDINAGESSQDVARAKSLPLWKVNKVCESKDYESYMAKFPH